MSGSLFTRVPEWLRHALRLQEPDLPNRLGEGPRGVWPVLDVGQGGWSLGRDGKGQWNAISGFAATGAVNFGTVPGVAAQVGTDLGAIFMADYDATAIGGGTVAARLQINQPAPAGRLVICSALLTAARVVPWSEYGGGLHFGWVPPGCTLDFFIDNSANVANAGSLEIMWINVPGGYNPY